MNILSDKQMKYHIIKLGHGLKRETLRETEFILILAQNDAMRTISKQE